MVDRDDVKEGLLSVGRFLTWPMENDEKIEKWLLEGSAAKVACAIGLIMGGYIGIAHIRSVGGLLLSCAIGAIALPLLFLLLVRILLFLYVSLLGVSVLYSVFWITSQIFKAVGFVLQISW